MMNTRCFILLGFLCFSVLGYSQSDKLEIGLNFETSHVIEGQVISDMPTVEGYLKYRVVPSFVITGEGRAAIAEKNGSHYRKSSGLWLTKSRVFIWHYSASTTLLSIRMATTLISAKRRPIIFSK